MLDLRRGTASTKLVFAATIIICGIVVAIYAQRCVANKAAVTAIRKYGGTFAIKYDGPKWLRERIGDKEYFYNCTRVNLGPGNPGYNRPIGDAEVALLVPYMNAFSNFHILDLRRSDVTDDGLLVIADLRFIDEFVLRDTSISDAGLKHLESIVTLKAVDLRGTATTPDGVRSLQVAIPNCDILTDPRCR
jgi:hypothetical protein